MIRVRPQEDLMIAMKLQAVQKKIMRLLVVLKIILKHQEDLKMNLKHQVAQLMKMMQTPTIQTKM